MSERPLLKVLNVSESLKLEAMPPYNFELTVHKPGGWSLLTPFESFERGKLWTTMRTRPGKMIGLKLSSLGSVKKPKIMCKVYSSEKLAVAEEKDLSQTLSWMLNLKEDIKEFYSLAKKDSLVKILARDLYGMRNTKQPDLFPRLILAVTLQMAPISRSNQMMTLLIKNYGEKVQFDNREILYWPSPERIASASVEELREKCKLGYRAKPLKDIAEAVIRGFPDLQQLEKMSSSEAKAKLMELNGIGEYSADIVLPQAGMPLDVWSAKIFSLLLLKKASQTPREDIPRLKKLAEKRWGKWRSYVFIYVLHDLVNLSKKLELNLTEL